MLLRMRKMKYVSQKDFSTFKIKCSIFASYFEHIVNPSNKGMSELDFVCIYMDIHTLCFS